MLGLMKVFRRVLILRRVAAAHLAANHAQAQVNPGVADFYALFADMLIGGAYFDLVQMLAFLCHDSLRNIQDLSSSLRSHFAKFAAAS